MEYSKIVYFKNWTDEDFTYKYDNKDQTFVAGKVYSMPIEIAQHFAHHLAVKECFKNKQEFLPKDKMKEYMDKCFPEGIIEEVKVDGLPINEVSTEKPIPQPIAQEAKEVEEPPVLDNKKLRTKKSLKKTKDSEFIDPNI